MRVIHVPRRRRVTVLATAAFITLGGLAAGPAQAAPTAGAGARFGSDPALNFAASSVAQGLTGSIASDASYGGLQITDDGIELSVVGAPSARITNAVAATATASVAALRGVAAAPADGRVPIKIRTVAHSMAQLESVTSSIGADATLPASGIDLSSWGPDVVSNTVVVHLRHYIPQAAEIIKAKFGGAVTVATSDENAAGSSRLADSAPWYGGDRLDASQSCTSWFEASKAGVGAVVLLSGHCGGGTFTNGGKVVGTVSQSAFTPSMDAEIIPVSSNSPYIWSDPTSTTRHVTGTSSSDPIGTLLCTDGMTDREVCSVKILAGGQTVNYDGVAVQGLVAAQQTSHAAAFSAGDSGGPVEATSGSTSATAFGMIEARNTSDASYGWYMPTRTLISYWGITVLT